MMFDYEDKSLDFDGGGMGIVWEDELFSFVNILIFVFVYVGIYVCKVRCDVNEGKK